MFCGYPKIRNVLKMLALASQLRAGCRLAAPHGRPAGQGTGAAAVLRYGFRTLGAIALMLAAAAASPEPTAYVLAVHPYLSAPEIQKRFAPLAEYLGQQLGRPVQVRVGSNYEEHISFVGQDAVDIAYIGPAAYVAVVERFGPKPILARMQTKGKPYLSGVIFVRQDSDIRQLADLRGKRFAFGDPQSTMGSLMPRYVLREAGISLQDLGHVSHVFSHDNVVLGVLAGDFDAGAVRIDVYDEMASRGLRPIALLPAVSEHVFVTRSNLPPQDIARLRQALLQLAASPDGPRILHTISVDATGMEPASDADYDGVRKAVRALAKDRG